MKKGKNAGLITAGFLAGVLLGAPTALAAVEYLQACPSRDAIYVDGQQVCAAVSDVRSATDAAYPLRVQMEAYRINGANYVKLRDVGQAVGFNVYWQDAVRIDTTQDYSWQAPTVDSGMVPLPADGSRYIPKAGPDPVP